MGEDITLTSEKAHSLDTLYRKVKDHDVVLTVDAPLADALNARLTEPRLGSFATTPRRLALSELSGEEKLKDKRELFLKIIDQTELSWKHAAYLLQNIISCWRETGEIDAILDHDRFDNEETKQVIGILSEGINPYNALSRYKIPDGLSVAVVALHQFSSLDRKILPDAYDVIDVFSQEEYTLPEFKIFNSATEIVGSVLKNIRESEDVAVVMKEESPYRHLLESYFRAKDIPYMVGMNFKENDDLRTYLNLLRFGLSNRGLKLKDIRPILYHLNRTASIEKDEFFIRDIDDIYVKELKNILDLIPSLIFKESVDEFETLVGKEQSTLKEHLDILGLLDIKITEEELNAFKYYLESFDISEESRKRGVLIASPASSAFIDRSIIFYLGMDASWTPDTPTDPWTDKAAFDESKTKDFKLLLQNGEQQHFMVQNRMMDQHVTPSYHFNELTDLDIGKFTDFSHSSYGTEPVGRKKPFAPKVTGLEPRITKVLSKSALNVLAYCPKDYFFGRVVDGPDKVYFKKGHLLHHFAEFYINHPDLVESQPEDVFVGSMMDEITPYIDDLEKPGWETQFRIGIRNLMKYLEPKDDYEVLPGYERRPFGENIFSKHFGLPITKPVTEAWFRNFAVGASGVVDLIETKNHIVDHKSGRKSTIGKIMKLSQTDKIDKKPEFQAKMYLAHHRSVVPNEPIRFTFFYILSNIADVIKDQGFLPDNIVDINYFPVTFSEMAHEDLLYFWLIEGVGATNSRRKTLELLGYDNYCEFLQGRQLPEDMLELADEFTAFAEEKTGKTTKYIAQGCESTLKKLAKFKEENYFKDDIDEFEVFLSEHIGLLNEYKRTGFPVGDIDIDELDNKDLVIL